MTNSRFLKVIQWGITLISLILLFILIDWRKVLVAFREIDYIHIILAHAIVVVHFWIGAWRWSRLIRIYSVENVSIRYLFELYIMSFFASSILPGTISGDLLRAYGTKNTLQNTARSSAIILAERILGMLIIFLIGGISFVFLPDKSFVSLINIQSQFIFIAITALIVAIAMAIFLKNKYIFRLFSWTKDVLSSLVNLISLARNDAINTTYIISGTFIYQILSMLIVYQSFVAMDIFIPVNIFLSIMPIITLILILPISIQGIGVRENIFILFLTPLGFSKENIIASLAITYFLGIPYILWGWLLFNSESKKILRMNDTL